MIDMRRSSLIGSAIVIILLNLLLLIGFSQSEPDPIMYPVLIVSDVDIDSAISHYPSLVLDCYKSGCGPCDELDVALDEIARDFQGNITFGKIDMKENLKTKEKYKINSYPTLLLFDDGILVDRIVGFTSKNSTKHRIASSFSLSIR